MRFLLIGLAVVLAPAVQAAEDDPRLVTQALPGFVVGYEVANAQQSIREEIPRGETVQSWTRMVTTQRFFGLADIASTEEYLGNVIAGLPRGCPGAVISPITPATVSKRKTARVRVDCPRNPATGKPETFLMLAVPIGRDIHVKQAAFRRVPSAADIAWAEALLAATRVCEAGASGC